MVLTWICSSSSVILDSSSPVIALFSVSDMIPTSRAIALAVASWSPVIIMGRIPDLLQSSIACLTSSLGGSIMPITPM